MISSFTGVIYFQFVVLSLDLLVGEIPLHFACQFSAAVTLGVCVLDCFIYGPHMIHKKGTELVQNLKFRCCKGGPDNIKDIHLRPLQFLLQGGHSPQQHLFLLRMSSEVIRRCHLRYSKFHAAFPNDFGIWIQIYIYISPSPSSAFMTVSQPAI